MISNSVSNNMYKPVKYGFNTDTQNYPTPNQSTNYVRAQLPSPTKEHNNVTPAEIPKNPIQSPDNKKPIPDDKNISQISNIESGKVKMIPSEIPDISFAPMKWSRDLVLYENKKRVISKTYYFTYDGESFPGVVTDAGGRIYLYDRNGKFHRPLKYLHRTGDPYSFYHAGFREENDNRKFNNNYIDLGTLEILQSALQSSVNGKYNVKITNNDSFMTNWMRATSPNENEKLRYWNGNVTKLNKQYQKNILTYSIPIAIFAPFTIPTIGIILRNNKIAKRNDVQGSANIELPNNGYVDSLLTKS
jgi:hypothetical protein